MVFASRPSARNTKPPGRYGLKPTVVRVTRSSDTSTGFSRRAVATDCAEAVTRGSMPAAIAAAAPESTKDLRFISLSRERVAELHVHRRAAHRAALDVEVVRLAVVRSEERRV